MKYVLGHPPFLVFSCKAFGLSNLKADSKTVHHVLPFEVSSFQKEHSWIPCRHYIGYTFKWTETLKWNFKKCDSIILKVKHGISALKAYDCRKFQENGWIDYKSMMERIHETEILKENI